VGVNRDSLIWTFNIALVGEKVVFMALPCLFLEEKATIIANKLDICPHRRLYINTLRS